MGDAFCLFAASWHFFPRLTRALCCAVRSAGEEIPSRRNFLHGAPEDEGDRRGLPRHQAQRCRGDGSRVLQRFAASGHQGCGHHLRNERASHHQRAAQLDRLLEIGVVCRVKAPRLSARQLPNVRDLRDLRPTAAAIAYGLDKKGSGERNVLIYDACRCIPKPFSKFEYSNSSYLLKRLFVLSLPSYPGHRTWVAVLLTSRS